MLDEDDGVLELCCCRLAGADMGALRGLDALGEDASDGVAAAIVGAGVCIISGGLESRAFGVDITGATVGGGSGPEASDPRSGCRSIMGGRCSDA